MYLHLVGSEQFGKSNFVFAVQETFGTIVMETKLLSSCLKISSFVFDIFISSVHVFGSSQKNWAGMCRPLPKTFALFMIKMCNFPYAIYDCCDWHSCPKHNL